MKHGTRHGYNQGCRCVDCNDAQREYHIRRKAGRSDARPIAKAEGEPEFPLQNLLDVLAGRAQSFDAMFPHVNGSRKMRWLTVGLTWSEADDAAILLGLHPFQVWGDDWWNRIPIMEAI